MSVKCSQVGAVELAWSNGRRDLCHTWSAPSQPASAPASRIRQPPQSMMATASGLIARTVSRHKRAETGQLQPEARKSADSANVPGHILLQQQVMIGRAKQRKPLASSNYPPTSYSIGYGMGFGLDDQLRSRELGRESLSPTSPWTYDRVNQLTSTHNVPKIQAPVAKFNLADEYRTNTANGFKFVRGMHAAAPSVGSPSTFRLTASFGSRTSSLSTGQAMKLPDTFALDHDTRNLTDTYHMYPLKDEGGGTNSRSGLMPSA